MKLITTFLRTAGLAAALVSAIGIQRIGAAEQMLVDPGVGVGKVRSGMTMEEVLRELGQPDRKSGQSLEYLKLGFAVMPNRQGIVAEVLCGDLDKNSPLVKAFKGRTKDGVGMGSSRAEVIKAFGPPSSADKSGQGIETLTYKEKGLRLSLSDGKVHHLTVRLRPAR